MITIHGCKLSDEEFAEVIKNTPLVSIDLIVKNGRGEILLGRRKNDPAKDFWFVPGGRICKDETLSQAFKRITKNELNLYIDINNAKLLGPFTHKYAENKFNKPGFGTHYVALAYEVLIDISPQLLEDSQHVGFKWFSVEELLKERSVHENTKMFFASSIKIPKDSGVYKALMSHYIHYDRQFWSRTQILLAIQGAVLVGGYNLRDSWVGAAIMIGGFILTLVVWGLIDRDVNSSRKNQDIMDELAIRLFEYKGQGLPIYLRSDPRFRIGKKYLSGQCLIHGVVILILLMNLGLFVLYKWYPEFFPDAANSIAMTKLEKQIEELSSRLKEIENNTLVDSTAAKGNPFKSLKRGAAKNRSAP